MFPKCLYKIISIEDWNRSEGLQFVHLPDVDQTFIHLSKEDQLARIIKKYWANIPEFIVLKIDMAKLSGTLIFEANPGGSNKYYHLYDGCIPWTAVVESNTIKRNL